MIFMNFVNNRGGCSSNAAIMKINTFMKSIPAAALIALTLLGVAPRSDARCRESSRPFISGGRGCGTPIYTERFFVGYDRCGNPVWETRVVRSHYRPVVRQRWVAPRPVYQHPSFHHGRRGRGHFQAWGCR
jgi:hypothetical protein